MSVEQNGAAEAVVAESAPVVEDPLDEVRAALSALREQERAHHARAEARERVIDHLHAEVERLRIGAQAVLLRPVVADLQHLRDDLLRQAGALRDDITREQAAELLASFAFSVQLALERCGSVPVRPSVGDPFSPREHRAVAALDARRPEQDGTIGAVLADGYRDTVNDRVTVPARVHVLRWHQPAGSAIGTGADQEDAPESGARQENADD